jgi:Bacterial Ig-like domain
LFPDFPHLSLLILSVVTAAALVVGQSVDGVSVTTDASSYAPGDQIQVTIDNAGPNRITRGGLDCDDIWPLALEQRQSGGDWQPVPVPSHSCIGIASVLVSPGESQSRTISMTLDPGTYHVVYAFDDVDNGTQEVSVSDDFDVIAPALTY